MARKATGSFHFKDGIAIARPRVGRTRPNFRMPHCKTPEQAAQRAQLLSDVASRLRRAPGVSEADIRYALDEIARSDARRLPLAVQVAEELGAGVLEPIGAPTETIEEYAERWVADRQRRGIRDARHNDLSRLRKHVFPVLKGRAIALLTRDEMRAVVESGESLDRGAAEGRYSWLTARKTWLCFRKMMSDACESKTAALRVRDDNPAASVRGPDSGSRKAKQWLFPSEALSLLSCAEVPLAWREAYAIGLYLYLRPGELFGLSWDAVQLAEGYVDVRVSMDLESGELGPTKTKRPRRMPIPAPLVPLLRRMHEQSGGEGAVVDASALPSRSYVHGVPERLYAHLRQHLKDAGVKRKDLHERMEGSKPIGFYDLRSSGITWSALAGTDPLKIMQRAGHEGFATTQGYIKTAEAVGVNVGQPFPPLPRELTGERAPAVKPPSEPTSNAGPMGADWTSNGRQRVRSRAMRVRARHASREKQQSQDLTDRSSGAHNPKVVGSNPAPATTENHGAFRESGGRLFSARRPMEVQSNGPEPGSTEAGDPLAAHLRQLRREAEECGDDATADAITTTLRAHLRQRREAREAAERAEAERKVIDFEGAKREREM